jgi:hypothetical protein
MNLKLLMVFLFNFSLILPASSQAIPQSTIQRLQKIYPSQSKEFIELRFKNAQSVFDKWRSFPPYFYEMVKSSKLISKLSNRQGLCTGDPHIENFGFLPLKKDSVQFGINDLDDATNCKLDLDLIRLYMAHKFFGVQFRGESFYKSYQSGLSGSQCQRPQYVKKLEKDALKKGRSISKKALKMLEEKNCSGEFSFISQDEQQKIISILEKESPSSKNKSIKLVHSCSRLKSHGGSAGEKRYVLFIQDNLGDLHHLELKPLVTPAPDVGAGISIQKRKEIFNRSVALFYGEELHQEYFPIVFQDKLYQRRPLWSGVQEISSEDLVKLATEEKQEVLDFEACTLGGLHRQSSQLPMTLEFSQMEAISLDWEKQFRQEMGH